MDQSVLDAVKRWPNVPAVYGWLSLTARGEWKLHPLGDAQSGGAGQGISNTQIIGFINRNYASQSDGAWFFQNGPQRVYVRLDAAPLILHVDPNTHSLKTHNGLVVQHILHWYCDETGQLYAQTDCGAGRVDDRDLHILAEVLRTAHDQSFFDLFEEANTNLPDRTQDATVSDIQHTLGHNAVLSDPQNQYLALSRPVPFRLLPVSDISCAMGFIPNPGPATVTPSSLGRKIPS
jgi:hypothetical protein